ncbi:MAG TPA: F0F1 ATP synthase subunit delta [bacterium]|nr:F0F1 ATP synthase subunit delta [bacterium]
MLKQAIATRYAQALFDLAREKDRLREVEQDFLKLIKLLEEQPELQQFLTHPVIVSSEKKKIIDSLFEGSTDELFVDFIGLIIDKNREEYLPLIKEDFDEMLRKDRGQEVAYISVPYELSETLKAQIASGLAGYTGKTVEIKEEVDPSLIAGIRVRIGDRVFDGSMKTRLEMIREDLMNSKV